MRINVDCFRGLKYDTISKPLPVYFELSYHKVVAALIKNRRVSKPLSVNS